MTKRELPSSCPVPPIKLHLEAPKRRDDADVFAETIQGLPFSISDPRVGSADWHARATFERDSHELRVLISTIINMSRQGRPIGRPLEILKKRIGEFGSA